MAIVQISAGSQRSVALDGKGGAWGWGAFKTAYPDLQGVLPAALCSTDKSEVGHRRYAQPYAQMLNPGAPFHLVADGSTHIVGACRTGALLACRPVIAPDHGAAHQTVQAIPEGIRQLATMQTVSLALLENGDVWSWGFNHQGQLGRLAQPAQNSAAVVDGLPAIASLACGSAHALALDKSGSVWSWGANQAGQLGDGTLKSSGLPVRVALPEPIASVAAGDTHSLAWMQRASYGPGEPIIMARRAAPTALISLVRSKSRPISLCARSMAASFIRRRCPSRAKSLPGAGMGWGRWVCRRRIRPRGP